ncbi:obscurin isoform X2 [Spodoptera frugiperda]|uniref:Hemolin n=1 Tax=Spodoptera frugiperda TaxID=7108 RepID=A0A9R0EMJ8_SPOFR|nr:obscurin isoform X2 [Spodoptera frugiperda]
MSFCRITGRSRGLPKPNYFPLLAPISPADAKRCCRITGKSYGLPSHHYIPVLLTARSSKAKCKITNVSGELGPHHYSPEINYGNRKHEILPDYRYIFPVLDGSTEAQRCLMEMLLGKQVTEDKRYVYTVQERRCSLVFSAQMEAAVRDGDVRDVMLAKDSDTVLIKTKHGRSVSMDFKDFTEDVEMYEGEGPNAEVLKQREIEELEEKKKKRKRTAGLSSMKKIFENKEKLAEVEEIEEEKLRVERKAKKAKFEEIKHDVKTFSYNSFDAHHMRSKSSIIACASEWRDQMHPIIETWDWETFEKDVTNERIVPKATKLPTPVKITPHHCDAEIYEVDRNVGEVSIPLEIVPCVNPLKPIKTRPSETVLSAVKEIPKERLTDTADVIEKLVESDKVDLLPTMENLAEVVKNIKKGKREKVAKISGLTLDINKAKTFVPGQVVNTPQGPVFVPGQTVETPIGPVFVPGLSVNTPAGPGLIPGHIVTNENTNEPFFLAGQVLQTSNGEEFVCGQTMKNKDDTYRFAEGQTVLSEEGLKFVPGKIINTGPEDVFVPGQTLMTPEGVQFIPGQTMMENDGITFTPGQNAKINNEWQFVPGQVLHQDDELHFVPGATIATPNGLKFVPGQTVSIDGETCFIPGITKTRSNNELEFVPGTTVETIDGPKFIEGQLVHTDCGEKFMPGKTIVQADGHVEFSVAKSIEDITFSEGAPVGLPIDIKTCSLSEESLYVFGHMVQTAKGIEFYPGPRMPKLEGKVVPGRLVKNEANESRFVPGMMVEGIFVPGQIVFTENGEQFVPGQVVDTADGPKFVPGQVVNTKSGPKFVPGQTIHTIDGPRFVPGQIIETKAGPTFIPGQVISTEDEGSRFVPGQVVDTEEGPRFVPGRVIETDDNGVTFIPGQIVQTPEGLKFVAPDLTEGDEGLEFSVQSFVVTPEELKLLKVKTNPNDTTSTKGELTIDTNMLRQLSEAGMSIGRQVPAELPAINVVLNHTRNAEALKAFVTDFGLKDEVANQLMDVITSIIEMSAHLKSEIHENHKENGLSNDMKKKNGKKRMDMQDHVGYTGGNGQSAHQEHVKNSIAAAVLAALVTAEQFEEVNNNNSKEKYQMILKSIDTILGKTIDEDLVSAMFNILQKEEDKELLREEILENSSQPKVELIKIAVNNTLHKHSFTEDDIIEKFGEYLSSENEVLGPAFKNISKIDSSLLHHVLGRISESISFVKSDREVTETLQKAIVCAVQEASTKELEVLFQDKDKESLKELITQSVGLARILGLRDVASNLLSVVNDEDSMSKIASDPTSLNILKRLTVMRKLADNTPSLHSALHKLETDPSLARTDPKLRDLVRESAALMIVPEETPLMTSEDVPLNLLDPENSLAMEDFLFQRRKQKGALLIMKKGLQAVVPREASRAVLTGEVAYTVLDENGIRHFEPLHVFSALNLSQPTAHRFSMYSCPVVDDDDEDLQSFTGYCNISNNQKITRLGGWSRRYSGVLLDRENTRSRMSSLETTPSYKRYPSRSMSSSRSRSSCSRSPPKVEDVVVASADYAAAADDEVSLKAGDIVEVLDTKSALGSKWLVRVIEDVQEGELRTRQGYVPADVLKEKQTAERDQTALAARRQAVVRELVETEEEFGRDMQQVVTRYMKPIDKATTPKAVFDNRELLFSNFRQICEFHNTILLEGIKYYASEPKMLGRALLRMEREFDKHVGYCRDEPRAQHLLATDPVVNKYFQDLADSLRDDKGISEHLKLPIQRINDYQLLLKELVKYSKRLGEDCSDLQKALELFLSVPNRATDNKFIASIEGFRGNIYKLGRLLTHDWFTVSDTEGKSRERYVFLFKARVLICKVKKVGDDRSVFVLKDIVKLPEVEIKENPEEPLKFTLCQKDPPLTVTLAAHKEQVKTNWLAEIRKHASDLVALAEHAADDLQVEPEGVPAEPEEKKKKRDHAEVAQAEAVDTKEKRSRVEETTQVATTEEAQQLKTKRKASIESEVATKISKSEVTEVSSVSETQQSVKVSSVSESSKVTEKTASVSQSEQTSQVTVVAAASEVKVAQATSVQSTQQTSVQSSTAQQSSQESSVQASSQKTSLTEQSTAQSSTTQVAQSSSQATSVESKTQEATSIQQTSSSVEQSSQQATATEYKTQASVKETTVEATVVASQQSTNVQEVTTQQSVVEETKESTVEKVSSTGAEVTQQATSTNQTVTTEEVGEDEMSRYSRSTRLSGEYSSSSRKLSGGGRYESSSTYDGSGLTSSYSRRESGSRLESSKYESGGAIEGTASSRYESKYSSKTEGGSKYGIESSYESKTESGSKYGIEYDSASKIDSIASKYGIEANVESKSERSAYAIEGDSASKIDSIASKYASKRNSIKSSVEGAKVESSLEAKYESKTESSAYGIESDTTSKIDSIASKYASKRNSIKASIDGDKVESISSTTESSYETVKNGDSSYESKYSKKSIANGSVSTGYESARSISKSESQDGKPIFTKTLAGQNIEPGENAIFECLLRESKDVKVTWLKDNKPLTDRLMDRCSISLENDGGFKLELKHCRESDAGVYTAIAENLKGNAHCTAQLVVQELTAEERRERNALKAPYFLVALKDTEIMENTYLRFMVHVKGDPNPDVKFYRDDKEILTTSESDRVSIIRTRADRGCYELVIADVLPSDAGRYSCRAMNIYGEVTSEATVTVVDDKNIFGELPPGGEGLLAKGEKPTFTWKRDGQTFDPEERFKVLLGDDEDSLALVFQHVKPEDAGIYTCVAKTSTGNISCSAELTVQGAVHELHREPEKPSLVIEHREAIVSAGASAMLELVCKGYPKPNVVFKHKGKDIEADTRHKFLYEDEESMSLVIKNVSQADAGEYQVTASNELGEDTTTMHLIVKAAPKIKKKIENQTCMVSSTHTVTIEIEGAPAPDVTFYKDGVEIKSSDRISIVKESDEVYKITIKDAKLTDTGSYSVVAKNEVNQCSDFWQWHVTSPPKVIKKMGENKVCEEKETVTFKVETQSEPAPTVSWYKNKVELSESSTVKISSVGEAHSLVITSAAKADAGEYSCEIRNIHGSTSDSCVLNVKSGPYFTQKLKDTTASEGDVNIEFTVAVEAYPEPTVKWYLGDVEITEKKSVFTRVDSGNTHKLILKEVSAEYSGNYSCRVSNVLGEDSCSATFTVNRKPRFTKSLIDMTVDAGQTLKLDVEVEGCPEPRVKWYKDGKEVNTDARIKIERDTKRLENYHLSVTLVKEEDGGEYEVRAENEFGSVSSKSTVTVHTREIHSTLNKEAIIESEVDDESKKSKKILEDDVDKGDKKSGKLAKAETVEEKSIWDDDEDGKAKKSSVDDVDASPKSGKKSLTEPEVAEEKSFWDDNDDDKKSKKPSIEEVDAKPTKGRKSITEPEVAEEKSFWDDAEEDKKSKKVSIEEVESKPGKGNKSVTEPEEAEEKSFWDDADDGKTKQPIVEEPDTPISNKARKSVTEPEVAEEKSFWDDVQEPSKPTIEEIDSTPTDTGKKSFSEPETAEEKSFWDENHNEQNKKPVVEEVVTKKDAGEKGATKPESIEEVPIADDLKSPKRKSVKKQSVEEPLSAETEGRVFETVTTFKTGEDGAIIMSKVSSSRSHGAIITGPAETHTLHKMTSKSLYYDDDDDFFGGRRLIQPNKPHTTSLEVEEIASHSYFLTEMGHYTIPDHVRRGTYGIIEEPQTDSEADAGSRCGKMGASRTVSIMSVSEDEMSWQNEPLSREISIEDLSKSIFDIDETRKVFSKDSYVRQTSFKEDYIIGEDEEESLILKQKSQKVFENDITEKLIHISKEFDENEYKSVDKKIDNVKNRIIEELVLKPMKNFDNITKDVTETTVERKRKNESKLFSLEEEVDDEVEALLRRSQRQRSILDDILNVEDEKAPPTIKGGSMKDGHAYESLPLVYSVEVSGTPKPTIRWLHDGKEVKPCGRVHITNDGDLFKLEIDSVQMKDAGKWQCEIVNNLGKQVQTAQLSVSPESEFRKPKFTSPLEAQRVVQKEPVSLQAVCTADPLPHVAWLLNGVELTPSATIVTSADSKDLDHGLKECTFTLQIPTGRHTDTGEYTIQATNKYGVGESSARLDILLRPEIEGLKDVTAVPFEETTFIANVRANPIAEVKWHKDGYVIQPSSRYDIVEDVANEKYQLTVKKVGVDDGGVYTLVAKNEVGETSQQAKLIVHTGAPVFTKPLQKQSVKDYDDITLKVRCDGVPKPDVEWYRDGTIVANDERHTVTTEVGGQVDSELEIKHFNASDAGKYKVRAVSLAGEAVCEAAITLEQKSPGFAHKLERQKDVDEGDLLELKAKVDGSPMPTAKWFKDGAPLSPDDSRVQQTALPDGTVKLSIEHVTPADCGAYKLVISNPHGDSSALCAVAVNPTPRKPSFSQELEDVKAVVGQPLKLEARVMAFPAPEIKWFKDGLPVRPSQAVNFVNQPGGLVGLSIDCCKPEDAGNYSLTVTNRLGEVASKAKVEVGQKERKPAFIAELQPTKVIEGFPVKLEVKILGHPPPTLKWTHNGKEIVPDGQHIRVVSQPDGTHALLIDRAAAPDAGQYGVVAANDKGETASNADLTVASRTDDSTPQERPRFIHGLRDLTAEEGQPLSVSVPFVGNPVPEVTWTKDGVPLKPSEKIRLTCDGKRVGLEISSMELPDAGVYSIKLVNPLGEDCSDGNINVRKVYSAPTFSQKFTDLQQLPTFDAKFPARVFGLPFPEITWYKDGAALRPSDKYSIKRDGDAACLYVRDLTPADAGRYKCVARNREGEATCEANLEVVDKIARKQKVEPPEFLKKIGDIEVFRGMSAKFTACVTGTPEPDVEWYRNDERLFPCERIRMDKESTGLLRLTIGGVDPTDVGTYRCRVYNPHGEASCSAQLTYDTLEPHTSKRPIGDQYSDFDKMKKTGIPMPLADRPIISRMADRHLTLGWKPSIPHGPRFPVTYQVEMCEVPDGDWFTARTGLRSCVCDIRNLEPFRDYKFRIRVENKYGVSDPSPFAITHRSKLEPDPPKFIPYLEPGIDFRPETSPYFPKDFDIERPPHDGYAQAPKFLRQETDSQYGVKGHNVNLFWFVYGYPKPKMTYYFNDEPIEIGGRYDWSYTRNGQATLFINKMLERDAGWYEAVATNEHGQARQRVRLEVAEYPQFIRRPEELVLLQRHTGRLEARVTGVPYPDIKWYKDWQPLAPSARIKIQFIEPDICQLVLHDAILKDEGLYSISARNVAGSVSSSAMIYVEESEHEYSDRIREHPPRIKPSTKPFGDFYDLGDELGRGVQGVVYHAAERLTGRNYAAKIMHGHSALKPFMKNELDILNLLNDRHLVRLHDAYEHEHTLALVLELAGGGELVRDRLLRGQYYTERDIAGYIRQVLRGLKYMHDNSVAHLGLTIGELLLSHAGSDELKLCDFGLSRRIQFNKHASLDYGMPEFVAPEVAAGEGVSFAADLWSLGIITYILLSGHSPFRGVNDRETLTRIREGRWDWHDEEWWSRLSTESRDFISKLLVYNWHERMDVNTALSHPWLTLADKIYQEEYQITTDRLRNYYNLYRDWTSNAQCRTWFRRKPLSGAYEHPSKMVYPPGETYTPEATPDRDRVPHDREPGQHDINFKQWDHPDWEVSATSESHYQNGPDTYLLQLRDTQFPVRLREYMKVACDRSPGYSLNVFDTYDPRTPIIRERRRFTDIMDEEIDDERRERINNYGTESYTIRRLRHELGTRLDSYAEAQALMESKKDGQLPFFREKPQLLPVREGENAQLSCFAVGDPKPSIQWFKNDMVIAEGQRIKIIEDDEGRSTLRFEPAKHHDIGFYKVVARNKVGQTVARTRIVEATTPDAPDSPTAADVSDCEVLLRWKQPKYDGNSPVICYSLQYKAGDSVEWRDVASNIDHEFFVVRNLSPDTSYQFRLSSRNRIGWSDKGIPTHLVKTKQSGAPKIEVTKAMKHLQQITESGQEVTLEENRPKLDYSLEDKPVEWESSQQFTERYSFVSELWRGKFSIVVKGIDRSNDNVVVSKILENRPDTEVQIQREFECLRRLRHERISNLIAAYQAPGSSVSAFILEKLQGADILTYLSSRHDYTEQMVATIVTQILDGLQYLHWRGYCHLDLQPDNVVMASVRSIQVKLIDFGSAHKVTKLGTSVPQVGDLEYKAPEIINDEPAYPQTDIWSVGVLTYIMLSGVSPFKGADDAETKQNISFVRFRFEHLYKEITQEATRFLMFLFKKVPLKRPLAEECYEHRWLTQSDFMNKKRERAVFLGNRLKEFSDSYHERKAREASQADTVAAAFGGARHLVRSNSIQDELLTTFNTH